PRAKEPGIVTTTGNRSRPKARVVIMWPLEEDQPSMPYAAVAPRPHAGLGLRASSHHTHAEVPAVSGTRVTPAAGGSQRDSAGPAGVVAARRCVSQVTLAIAGFTVLGLVLRLSLLSRPGYLLGVTQYDDGPYFGSA